MLRVVLSSSARVSIGTSFSTTATNTRRWRWVSCCSTARRSATSSSRHWASWSGWKPNRAGSWAQSSSVSRAPGRAQKCLAILAETSNTANEYAQVVNRLSPRNWASLAVTASVASAAAW